MQRTWPTIRFFFARSSLLIAPLAVGACLDQGPVASLDPPPVVIPSTALQVLDCIGSISGTVTCDAPGGAAAAPAGIVVGGQGTYLQLVSSNVSYDGGTEVFSFDVTVQNLLRESIGTPDGSTPDPDGIRVFFADGPTATDGAGTIEVMNADGLGTFTGSDQPFFTYGGILERNDESAARTWELGIPSTVNTFSFTVFVQTEVEPLLVINEVMVRPGGGVPETEGQWFEIYNAGTLAVDLQNMVIADSTDLGRGAYHLINQRQRVAPGGYAVLGTTTDTSSNGGAPVSYAYGPDLALVGSHGGLKIARVVGPDTLTIDRVSWLEPSIAAREGVSRELVSPGLDNSDVDGVNWVDGSDVYGEGGVGTPGEANTALSVVPQVVIPVAGQDQSAPAGSDVAIPPAVRIEDVFGTPLAGQQVIFTVTAGGGTVTGDTVTTLADGIAAVGSWTLGAGPGTNTLEARVGDLVQLFNAEGTLDCMTMAVGEVWTTTLSDAAQACFTGETVQEYTLMPVNPTPSALSLTVTGSGIQGVTGPPSPAPGLDPASPLRLAADVHLTPILESRYDHLPAATAARGVANLARLGAAGQRAITPGVPAEGDLWSLNVAEGCAGTPDVRTGRVVSVGTNAIAVADTANPAGGFTTAQYDSIVAEADSIAYPTVTENFGIPSDIDGNGRLVLFFTRAVNELSPPASSVITYGLFRARDLFPDTEVGCSLSNVGELLYFLVPDSTGAVNSNVRTVASVRGAVISTLGAELQRLVNASRRLVVNGGSELEEPWLDRGLSAIAQELLFYRMSVGLAPGQNIGLTDLTSGPNASRRVAAFNTYVNPNFGRLRPWMQRPDTSGVYRTNETLAQQGAAWAFLRYAADRHGGNQADFWASLVNSNLTGKANLANAIGADPDEWLRDFVASMYADDAVPGIPSTYTQPSWNFRSVYGGLGGFPLGTRLLTNDVGLTLNYAAGGSTAFIRFGIAAGGEGVITLTTGGEPTGSNDPLAVVRTR